MTILVSGGRAIALGQTPQVRLQEAVTEVSRSLEDLRWTNLSTDPSASERGSTTGEDRKRDLTRIRTFRRKNPLARRAALLLQNYVVGQGVSWKAENKKLIARVVDEFWSNTVNQRVLTSHEGIKWFLDRNFTDGEFFLVLFPDEKAGTVEIGHIDALFVDDVITDPGNSLIPHWYKVTRPATKFSARSGQYEPVGNGDESVYYRDWRNTEKPPRGMKLMNGLVYHVMIERSGKRGVSQLEAAIDWLRVHQGFMGDRATINKAAAEVGWKKKRTGGANDVAAEVDRLRSTLATNLASWERNPPSATASTVVENAGSTLEWVKKDTGAAAAAEDERGLRMMVGSSVGVPNHYFGDEADANLATATAMELPLLKQYEDWQQFVEDVLVSIVEFVLQTANNAGRIPDRDDERKYSERNTTQQVAAGLADQGGGNTVAPTEAFGDPTPEATPGSVSAGVKLVMVPRTPAAAQAQLGGGEPAAPKTVSWYVDIDFPPIIQKEIYPYVQALQLVAGMLPSENIESRKIITEFALTALGDNDVESTMSRLYPDDMVAMLVPNRPPQPPPLPGEEDAPPRSLAEARVRRLIALAQRADDPATVGR